MRTVNTFIEDTIGSIEMGFTDSNLDILMNCRPNEIANSIPKDQLEFSFGQNIIDSMVDYDFSFDLSKDLEEFMNDSPSIREGMEKAGLKNPTGIISLLQNFTLLDQLDHSKVNIPEISIIPDWKLDELGIKNLSKISLK